ncbi:hypothetical protein MAFF211271_26150 [Ralstonia syzygii subsp. indonesiensis]|nr:hypothetical protein MAFF211271_26150 [Ralstonia pseudosolanacearum]
MAPFQITRNMAGLRNEGVRVPGGGATAFPMRQQGDGGLQRIRQGGTVAWWLCGARVPRVLLCSV